MRKAERRYTEQEDEYIVANYHTTLARDIANHLNRSITSIRKRAAKLGQTEPLKRWTRAEDEIIRAGWGKRQLDDVAGELNRCLSETSSRAKKLGCKPWRIRKGTHSGRPVDGFANGKPVYTHRAVVERSIGRKLKSSEIVHHIDCDKNNNDIRNLFVFKTRSAHRKAHCTLEQIVPILVERGIVEFDITKGVYKLCETNN